MAAVRGQADGSVGCAAVGARGKRGVGQLVSGLLELAVVTAVVLGQRRCALRGYVAARRRARVLSRLARVLLGARWPTRGAACAGLRWVRVRDVAVVGATRDEDRAYRSTVGGAVRAADEPELLLHCCRDTLSWVHSPPVDREALAVQRLGGSGASGVRAREHLCPRLRRHRVPVSRRPTGGIHPREREREMSQQNS